MQVKYNFTCINLTKGSASDCTAFFFFFQEPHILY
jgi:hypothetical protein